VGASATVGAVSNMDGDACKPGTYKGYFLEGGGGAGAVGGGAIGLNEDENHLPDGTRSYVDEIYGGVGLPGVSVMLCYYWFIGEL
jgi:hypothetical protein